MSLQVQITPTRLHFDESPTPSPFGSAKSTKIRGRLNIDQPSPEGSKPLYFLHDDSSVESKNRRPRAREWPVRLRRKGLLAGHAWSARRAIVSKDALRVAKGAKTVATIRLDKAQLDTSVTGPRKGVPALKITDGATTLVLAATEDHAGFVRYASRRAAETKFNNSPVMEVRPTLERDTIVSEARESFLSLNAEAFRVYLEALSMDELADVLTCVKINQCAGLTRPSWFGRAVRNRHRHAIEQASRRWRGGQRNDSAPSRRKILIFTQVLTRYEHELTVQQRGLVAEVIAAYDTDEEDCEIESPPQNTRMKVPSTDSTESCVEDLFKAVNAAPVRGQVASGALEISRTPPLVRCMRKMSAHEGPSSKLDKPCDCYQVDLTASNHTTCVCGHPKAAHVDQTASASKSRIRAMADAYEDALKIATERADLEERLQRARDPLEIAQLLRKLKACGQDLSAVPPPTIANVAGEKHALPRVQVASRRRRGTRPPVRYVVVSDGKRPPTDMTKWTTASSGVAAFDLKQRGRLLVAAVTVDGAQTSTVATAYFTRDDDEFLFHEKHASELKATEDEVVCSVCAAPCKHGFEALDGVGGLCEGCAKQGKSVGVDVGARRLWLSEPVSFKGNDSQVRDESKLLVGLVAKALTAHPGLAVRVEGHTNSACGLDCDGSEECLCLRSLPAKRRASFREGGGAVGFSRRRAEAVRAMILGEGVLEDRISAKGMAGARRLCADTEDRRNNHKNRRVEIHCQ